MAQCSSTWCSQQPTRVLMLRTPRAIPSSHTSENTSEIFNLSATVGLQCLGIGDGPLCEMLPAFGDDGVDNEAGNQGQSQSELEQMWVAAVRKFGAGEQPQVERGDE